MSDPIVRIAARGDGVSASGRHVPFGVPGDAVDESGLLIEGPHHQTPPCRHFPECGGCQLQHADDEAYRSYLRTRIETALAQHRLSSEIRAPHLSPPNSRRRAGLRALRTGKGVVLGFNAERSNRIVDMRECHILRPELFALVAPLRRLLADHLGPRGSAELRMTLIDGGVDLLAQGLAAEGYEALEAITDFCRTNRLARLSIDRGLGPEILYEPEPASVTLSGKSVVFPVGGFLQATADGESALVDAVREAVGAPGRFADLFAGIGTFALALPGRPYAAEASRDAVIALKQAAPAITVDHRDLYRRPLDKDELRQFDAVVLDPPRAGAEAQMKELAQSSVARIAYVSCNPATFARDCALLVGNGYRLDWVQPVGQFRWSTHVELAGCLSR